MVIPICEVNTEELCVWVRIRENGTSTSEQALGRPRLKHWPFASSSGSINTLEEFFDLLSPFGKITTIHMVGDKIVLP